MEVYLLRHGLAELALPGHPDAARQLTAEGKKKTAEVIRLARRAGLEKPRIVSSPYLRAMATARVAAEELGLQDEPIQSAALVPHSTPEAVWAELHSDWSDEPAILLASHEPLLSDLAGYLLNSPALQVEVKKSSVIRIDLDARRTAPRGVLRWMITPRLAG